MFFPLGSISTIYSFAAILSHNLLNSADIQKTLSLEQRHFGALSGLGLIYSDLGQKEAALKAFRAALAINPHMEEIRRQAEELTEEVEGMPL